MAKKEEKQELPSNSKANRVIPMRPEIENGVEPKRKSRVVRPVVASASVVREKKSVARSIAGALTGDTMRNLVGYIIGEVIVPTGKNLVEDVVKNTVDQVLYGGETRRPVRNTDSKVSYGSFYKSDRDRRDERPRRGRSANFDLDNIFFKRHNDAEDVLEAMCEQLEEYDEVTVADYFDMAGVDGATWTHNKWGWKDLTRAYCTHTRRGYAIVLPPPVELD